MPFSLLPATLRPNRQPAAAALQFLAA